MRIAYTLILSLIALMASAVNPAQVRWHNEATDTTRITAMLLEGRAEIGSSKPKDYVSYFAKQLLGTPYVAATLESDDGNEWLTVNLDELDCTTLVDNVIALSLTAASGRTSWRDFINRLEEERYRSGKMADYASRLHYIADWIVDLSARGIVEDVTTNFPGADYQIKTLDFMSSHADSYPALADPDRLAAIKNVEAGYRSHRFPYVKKTSLISNRRTSDTFREGDIIAITTDIKGLDVSHLAIVTIVDGKPHMLHASSAKKEVIIDPLPLPSYIKNRKGATGVRVIRLAP